MKKTINIILILFLSLVTNSCAQNNDTNKQQTELENNIDKDLSTYSKAYFASGCFWCVEAIFESVKGVEEVISGYSGGEINNPNYQSVSSGTIKHAEAVEIYYDSSVISFESLVIVFFGSHDPTTFHRQGPDAGPQYRSIAFYQNEYQKSIINSYIAKLNSEKKYTNKIVTEVTLFEKFYKAEDYHQNYEKLHPENPYVRSVSIPRLIKFQTKYPELLKTKVH